MEQSLGFDHFLSNMDIIGKCVLAALLALSMASWYLILTKMVSNMLTGKRAEAFLSAFWDAGTLDEFGPALEKDNKGNAFANLAQQAHLAMSGNNIRGAHGLAAAGGIAEYITRTLRNGIDQEAARIESGLTVLASAGSTAPYIGLFGTVWGIYHALVYIGMSGQGTLDKVAGPVGEALIMTALGLAVAIPASLAYNYFNRRNRIWLSRLDAFAHDLYALVTVGDKETRPANKALAQPVESLN
jgi:biopolymer transport protein ExbB